MSIRLILFFSICLSVLYACAPRNSISDGCTADYWVSTSGSDSAKGSEADPFLTIGHARDVVRADPNRGVCTINVNIEDGTYRLTSPLTFNAGDSGSQKAPVVYKAAVGANPVISGAKRITGWTLHDAALNIWQANVAVETDTMPRQLYVNGSRAVCPNG